MMGKCHVIRSSVIFSRNFETLMISKQTTYFADYVTICISRRMDNIIHECRNTGHKCQITLNRLHSCVMLHTWMFHHKTHQKTIVTDIVTSHDDLNEEIPHTAIVQIA
jgi:hypothetical protein